MNDRRNVLMGISFIAVIGVVFLNITPKESLGCGGTEFETRSKECPVAEFGMTPQVGDWDPLTRKMCLKGLKTEGGCTVYEYSIAPLTEAADSEPGSEPSEEYVEITYGSGCAESLLEGSLVEIVEDERVVMALSGTLKRAPLPIVESTEPLATGDCTSKQYGDGNFKLFVQAPRE